MVNISKDLKYGLVAEDKVFTLLKEKINKNIIQTPQFHSFDYFDTSANKYYELKTRRCSHKQYPDTMVGKNKLTFAKENPDNEYIFIFNFTDGIYYHNWNKTNLYRTQIGGRYDRGRPELNEYFYIKREDLQKFENI